ncbi:MAG: uracil phosphoribosyltransferase [Saprospiraceae bacterium]|nr:uracil phosphoribosyltransferase [Saprospiraceae bacterium]
MLHNFSLQKSILSKYLYEMRSVEKQKDSMRFRINMERMGEIMAYELSKFLHYAPHTVETPLGEAQIDLPVDSIVLASILRAGLPLHNGFLRIFDDVENGFISAYRSHHKDGTFDIKLEYVTCPNLEGKVLIVLDPMLATGASIHKTLEHLEEYGKPRQIHVVSVIASDQGIKHVQRFFPNARIWTGAIDEELTAKSYIVPGLGDAGDLSFGIKLQE